MRYLQRSGNYRTANVLDIGCGKEFPLAKLMYVNKMSPRRYIGVDVNKLEMPEPISRASNNAWFYMLPQTDVSTLSTTEFFGNFPSPNVVVSFEALEHMTPKKCRRALEFIHEVMDDEGVAFISTPCFNGSAAQNHINEMTYRALGALIEDLGFVIEAHYGTFASISDYINQLVLDSTFDDQELPGISVDAFEKAGVVTIYDAFVALREYYDTNVLATIFAPLYPQFSRNVLWRLRKFEAFGLVPFSPSYERKFPTLAEVETPWSSSPHWEDLDLFPAISKSAKKKPVVSRTAAVNKMLGKSKGPGKKGGRK